jgi:Cu/Ag efflux protein CusF
MKRIEWGTVAGLGVAGLLALGLPARADDKTGTSGSSTSGQSSGSTGSTASSDTGSSHQVSGTVQKFDKDSKEMTLSNSDKKLKLNDQTKVTKKGQAASASDIHEGDQVRASFSGSGDEVDVLMIEVVPADTTPSPGK